MSIYGFSERHDAALKLCIASRRTCPTGCVKDGAPNCYAHVVGLQGIEQCEFGAQTAHLIIKSREDAPKQDEFFKLPQDRRFRNGIK